MLKEILNKANIVTYLGLIVAIVGMIMAFEGKVVVAVVCLMISGICDAFDGTIAKKIRKEEDNEFGVQLDSLVDVVSSGIFPIIIMLSLGCNSCVFAIIYGLFIISGVTRLAYYNINKDENKNNFVGAPITTSTILLPILYFLNCEKMIYAIGLLVLSVLYISPIKIKKLTLKSKIILVILAVLTIIIYMLGV